MASIIIVTVMHWQQPQEPLVKPKNKELESNRSQEFLNSQNGQSNEK